MVAYAGDDDNGRRTVANLAKRRGEWSGGCGLKQYLLWLCVDQAETSGRNTRMRYAEGCIEAWHWLRRLGRQSS